MNIRLASLQFHTGLATDPTLLLARLRSLNSNDTDPVPVPEWLAGRSRTAKDAPVAICLSLLNGTSPHVRIAIERQAADSPTIFLRALDGSGGNLLGRVGMPDGIEFDFGEAATAIRDVELAETELASVAIHDDIWDWQWRIRASDPWQDLARTRHRVMVCLAPPKTAPWSELTPWIDVLEVAARWAAGATTPDGVARRVTRAVFALGVTSPAQTQF